MNDAVLQSIIGTDKRNPYLQVLQHKNSGQLEIYYGAQLLETVVGDKEHISFRAAVGRLYNAGLNRENLSKVFGVDRKTMQRWGQALLAPDAESSIRGLRSRRDPRKLTAEIRKFAEVRFGHIYKNNRGSYSSQIRKEIHETFGVHLSPESLRPVFAACKTRLGGCRDRGSVTEDSSDDSEGERCL
jgi:transposase